MIKSQQNSDEKTRNVYRAKTMAFQGTSAKIVENGLKRQATNQSDNAVLKPNKAKKDSSCESTKLDTIRKMTSLTVNSQDETLRQVNLVR